MATEYDPRIGDWYKNVHGDTFEIVAIDRDDGTLEIQYFDGTIEELELDTWQELSVEPAEPPEDWSGSLDIDREDYGVDLDQCAGSALWANPLDRIDYED
ncbi:MAG: hypothetical protein LC646_05440 [Xanthomonadaceae bacterium]|nr:hypothetical protein [Xanthomonadaceae bacterium]